MNGEIELKLGIPAHAAHRVVRLPWLRRLSSGPPKRRQLRTVYFDTRKSKLHDRGLVLRVRHVDKQFVQTIKAEGNGAYGPFERGEWEHEVPGAAPNLKLAEGTPLEPLATKKLKRKLKPVFETIVQRTTFPLRSEGAELELAVDRGYIKAPGIRQRERISEIEIEVKTGDPGELFRIARQLARYVVVAYGARSKDDRGFALSRKQPDAPVRGAAISLHGRLTAGEAFQAIGFSCLGHALANDRAIQRGDPEGVHQMRIGLRRLRAAISLFKKMLRGSETEAIKRELEWLTEQLGPTRDLDVLIGGQVRSIREASPVGADVGALEQDLQDRRKAEIDRARGAVESDRYRALGLQAALWLAHGEWSYSEAVSTKFRRETPLYVFAEAILAKRTKKLLRKVRKIERLDPRARHKLRIGVKKLRYACEFFAAAFAGGDKQDARRERFRKALKRLQGFLGTLNDIEVHKRFAQAIARSGNHGPTPPGEALAMGFITGREDKQISACLTGVEKAAARLAKVPAYWK